MSVRPPLSAFVALLVGASLPRAQEVRELLLEHRSGQTFLTWRESAAAGTSYRVYRSGTRFSSSAVLDQADLLGEVDDRSSRNDGRSLATGTEHAWVIAAGAPQLSQTQGLFVHTIAEGSVRSYYAVTSILAGVEDRRLKNDWNTNASSLSESAASPQPVLQVSDASGELWAHWTSDRDTPFQPAFSPWPSEGFNFRFEPGSAAGRRGLVLGLHAAGQSYSEGWPHRFELPRDVDLLRLNDMHPNTNFSFWFGAHERFPSQPTASTEIWNYTQQRVQWTLDWMTARLGAAHDPERVYVVGGSLGAIGGMLLAGETPGRFAAILLRNGLYDLETTDYRNPDIFERLYGDFALGLRTQSGMPILERFDASHMANLAPAEDWPVIRTLSGRYDETVGWSSSVGLIAGLAAAHRPATHYFDERTHNPQGYWEDLERTLLARTCQTRRDRPSLRFENGSLDDDAGNGARTSGDPVGTINGYLDYDLATAGATPSGLDFDVYLRASGALDDAPAATGWAALTPRRIAPFTLTPGARVRFTLSEGSARVDEHVLIADANGLVHTPLVPLERTHRHARFERWSPGPEPLFLGAAPIRGDLMQAVVTGAPGASWTVAIGLGTSAGAPFTQLGVDHVRFHGTFDAFGFSELWLRLPTDLQQGDWIWGQAFSAGRVWGQVGTAVQIWP